MSSSSRSSVSTSSSNMQPKERWCGLVLAAAVVLGICWPTATTLGAGDLPTVTSVYVIQPGSTVLQSGGYNLGPSISIEYPVAGTFQLLVQGNLQDAYFVAVDAMLTETSDVLFSQNLDVLFGMTYSTGVVLGDNTIEFTGTASDGSNSDIVLHLEFQGDFVQITGETIPPNYYDHYYYQLQATAVRKYGGGTGDRLNPYLIATGEHLNSIGVHPEDWESHFKMIDNVDLAGYRNAALNLIGEFGDDCVAHPFSGVFNGNGHSISNLSYTSGDVTDFGLFRFVDGPDAEITNVEVVDPNIDVPNGQGIGTLVGCLGGGAVVDCTVSGGRVLGADVVGGLVGRSGQCRTDSCDDENPCSAGQVRECQSSAAVTGLSDIGGLVGGNNGTVADCNATGLVTGQRNIGGLVGTNGNSVANGLALGTVVGATNVGGLVGRNAGVVCAGHSAATVTGLDSTGGLVGINDGGSVTLSDASATVDGSSIVGGLVGTNAGNVSNSLSAGAVTGDLYVGGLVGRNVWRVSACYSGAAVTAQYGHAGGLVGRNEAVGRIADCYASGAVASPFYAGGLLGFNDGVVMKCYASGPVDGVDDLGGLVGGSTDEACTLFSFWDIETSDRLSSAGGLGLTTALMKTAQTFEQWGACTDKPLWTVNDGQDYPRLAWEGQAGQAIEPIQLGDVLAGSGDEDDPFLVFTGAELNTIGLFPCEWDKHFELAADVTMSAQAEDALNPIGYYRLPFTGVFNGAGYAISDLTYSPSVPAYAGLFGCVSSLPARIENLGLVNATVLAEDTDGVGALVGCLREGTVVNCYAENVSIAGRDVAGGLVGENQGTLQDCSVSGSVAGGIDVGVLAGRNEEGTLAGCSASGLVAGLSRVGGLVGDNNGTISGSFSESTVSAGDGGGGLVGLNRGAIEDAYASGQIVGNEKLGGLTGSNRGTLARCYATGAVTGDTEIGGLSGTNLRGTITACHAEGTVYGRLSAGGLVGSNAYQGELSQCYAIGGVSGFEWIGGLVGRNEASISVCYASGGVSGMMDIGGLAGANLGAGAIDNCYAVGRVSGYEGVGGLVGTNGGAIQNAYAAGVVVGATQTVGGLAGLDYGSVLACLWDTQASGLAASAAGNGKTTAQMKARSTFTAIGWDFAGEAANGNADLWQIIEGQSYPTLSWEASGF